MRAAFLALADAAVLAAAQASAYEVVRSNRPLAQTTTQLAPSAGAPQTVLTPQAQPGGLSASEPATALQPARSPSTILREAEVPPERLEKTRELLQELKAEPTPQQAISIALPADVLFDFDKAELRPDAGDSLQKAAELVQGYPKAPLTVRGHTDGKGSDAYNDELSMRRARAVAAGLEGRSGRKASVEGLGKREPVAPNTTPDGQDNPQGRQLNRRVQILIGVPTS
ncbi:MAG: OmpA family protein [Comamonas sp.]